MPADVPQRCQPLLVVEQMVKAAGEQGHRKRAVQHKGLGVPLDQGDAFPQAMLFSQLALELPSHRRRWLDGIDLDALPGQRNGDPPRARADVEHADHLDPGCACLEGLQDVAAR